MFPYQALPLIWTNTLDYKKYRDPKLKIEKISEDSQEQDP